MRLGCLLLSLSWVAPTAAELVESSCPQAPSRTIELRALGAFGDGESHPLLASQIRADRATLGRYRPGDEWDAVALDLALRAARPGDRIVFAPGSYRLALARGERATIASCVTIEGNDARLVSEETGGYLLHWQADDARPIHDVTVRDLFLRNVRLIVESNTQRNARRLLFERLRFEGLSGSDDLYYLLLGHTRDARISDCEFRRAEHVGRGVGLYRTRETAIEDSYWNGRFRTAINLFGAGRVQGSFSLYQRNSSIDILRNRIFREPGDYAEDHGIYAWGVLGLRIRDNEIAGWSPSASGGAIKIANAERITVRGNVLQDSGVRLYTYAGAHAPEHLREVRILENEIRLASPAAGILYWRNFPDRPEFVQSGYPESAIEIRGNRLLEGSIAITGPAHCPAFAVSENVATGTTGC